MLCALWLKRKEKTPEPGRLNRLFNSSEHLFTNMQLAYGRTLKWAIDHRRITLLILIATICFNVFLYIVVPKGFFPQQDTGQMFGVIRADQSISFQAMQEKMKTFMAKIKEDPAIDKVTGYTGSSQTNTSRMFISLKPLSERKISADEVIGRLRRSLANEPGATLFLQSVQDIRMGGRQSNAQYQYTLQGDNLDELREWTPKAFSALAKLPMLADLNTDQELKGRQTMLAFDRDAMSRLGLTQQQVDDVLYNAFGQRQVSTIYNELNQYKVVMEVAPQYWQNPESLNDIYIQTQAGPTPLSAIASWKPTNTSLSVNHQGQFASSTLSFNLPPGNSLSDATIAIEQALSDIGMPSSIVGSFQGTAKTFQESLSNQPLLIALALVAVYIVLGMLYESFIHPVTILSTLPSAGVGALLALILAGTDSGHRPDRRTASDRYREKERHHDDRLRAGCRTRKRPLARKRHLSGLPAALPPDHDDHDRRIVRRAAAGAGSRRRRGNAHTAGHFHRRRPDSEPVAHAVHDTDCLSVS